MSYSKFLDIIHHFFQILFQLHPYFVFETLMAQMLDLLLQSHMSLRFILF